jgi:geranylgeranyl pyrophosphate synthase
VTVDDYLAMIGGKSAALIAAATQMGAMLAAATPVSVAHYRRFGQRLGLAFQIADDVLGIWGDPAVTGKPAADDIARRKKSLPVVYALGQPSRPRLAALYRQEVLSPDDVPQALDILDAAGAQTYAQGMAANYRDEALAELAAWEAMVREGGPEELQALLPVLAHWREELLHYFSWHYTNGLTEGKNNCTKALQRQAYGYRNRENLRLRILLLATP